MWVTENVCMTFLQTVGFNYVCLSIKSHPRAGATKSIKVQGKKEIKNSSKFQVKVSKLNPLPKIMRLNIPCRHNNF